MKKFKLFVLITIIFLACEDSMENDKDCPTCKTGTVTDIDGNEYKTVKIGEQWWMAEDLKVTQYADGTQLNHVPEESDWKFLSNEEKAYCYYDNNPDSKYGVLYTWSAATGNFSIQENAEGVQGVCPDGWHIPSNLEYEALENFILEEGHPIIETGKPLKSLSGWDTNNGTDEYGFNAFPGGQRGGGFGSKAPFSGEGIRGFWWSSYAQVNYASILSLHSGDDGFYLTSAIKKAGFCVRCIKD